MIVSQTVFFRRKAGIVGKSRDSGPGNASHIIPPIDAERLPTPARTVIRGRRARIGASASSVRRLFERAGGHRAVRGDRVGCTDFFFVAHFFCVYIIAAVVGMILYMWTLD